MPIVAERILGFRAEMEQGKTGNRAASPSVFSDRRRKEKRFLAMKSVRSYAIHPLEAWRCSHCGYTYEEREYILPILQCPKCGSRWTFERVTQDWQFHPGDNLMLLP